MVEPVDIPLMEKMHGVHTAICDGQAASYHRGHLRERYMDYDYNTRVRLLVDASSPPGLQTLAPRARALMGQTMLDVFDKYDVLVGSTGQGPAGPIVNGVAREEPVRDARTAVMARGGGTGSFSMAGAAAISIPAGFTKSGLPVGWHLGTRPLDEQTLFRVCHAYQQATTITRSTRPWTGLKSDPPRTYSRTFMAENVDCGTTVYTLVWRFSSSSAIMHGHA